MKIIKQEGVGEETPPKGTKVEVHYTGTLTDGTEFDSSHNHGSKFTFNLGKGQVIKAWDLCVASMKRGEICEVTCAAEYAYGKLGSPPSIPANATLIFEIELFDWQGEDISPDGDKSILKEMIEDGSDSEEANEGSTVNVTLVGKYDGKVFEEKTLTVIVDEDDDHLIPAIPIAIKTMKTNERCRIQVSPKYAYGNDGNKEKNIPADATVVYEITMNSMQRCKESWEMNDQERIDESAKNKSKGTEMIKVQNYAQAEKFYRRAVDNVDHLDAVDDGVEVEIIKKAESLRLACYLNMALCQIKQKDYVSAVHNCNKALESDPQSEKALFRRGEAQFAQRSFKEAKESYEMAVRVNPENKTAKHNMVKCKNELKKQQALESKTYKGMFEKFSQQDERNAIKKKVEQQQEKLQKKQERKAAAAASAV